MCSSDLVHGFCNWKLVEAESRILKQSSEQRERQFSEPLRCLKMWEFIIIIIVIIIIIIIIIIITIALKLNLDFPVSTFSWNQVFLRNNKTFSCEMWQTVLPRCKKTHEVFLCFVAILRVTYCDNIICFFLI